MKDLLISICMMVKNEENNLPRCLESLKPLLSKPYTELIIIDTGSSDRTVEISQKYTSNVFHHPWNNHFAEMRNISISYAKGEWLFIIDADEELVNPNELIHFLESGEQKEFNSVQLSIKSFTNSNLARYSINPNIRIYRKSAGFKFVGSVHNQPLFKKPTKHTSILLNHYGYFSDDKELMENKFNRTSKLLKAELAKSPDNVYYRFQLARSYLMHNDIIEGYEEIKKAHDTVVQKQNLKRYFYVYGDYIRAALRLNKFEEAKTICAESIELRPDYIDAYLYLGLVQYQTGERNAAIDNFKTYLKLYSKGNSLSIMSDPELEVHTLIPERHSEVLLKIAAYYYDQQRYEEALEYANLALDNRDKIKLIIKSSLAIQDYRNIKDYYVNLTYKKEKELKNYLIHLLEEERPNIGNTEDLDSCFVSIDDEYGLLSNIRTNTGAEQFSLIKQFINKYDLNELPLFYSTIFKLLLDHEYPVLIYLSKLKTIKIKQITKWLIDCNYGDKLIDNLIDESQWRKSFEISRVYTAIANVIILNHLEQCNGKPEPIYPHLFEKYLEHGLYICENLYQKEKYRLVYKLLENKEHSLFMTISLTQEALKNNNTKLAIKYYQGASLIYPYVSRMLKDYQDKLFGFKKESMALEDDKSNNTRKLTKKDQGDLLQVKSTIKGSYAPDIKLTKGHSNNKSLKDDINSDTAKLEGLFAKDIKVVCQHKKRIAFFSKGDDKFIWDIINGLSEEYETKKITVANLNQIDKGMEWADICWFEWCDDLVIYGSKLEIASNKKIICRIHGYEVYTNYIQLVNWSNVDSLIIVAPHIRRIFEQRTKNMDKTNLIIDTVFCGLSTTKFPLEIKNKGFNLGYLGYINFKKNIPLTLDIFKRLHDLDSRYKLHIAGEFQCLRTLSYLNYFIKEHSLQDAFVFDGWLNDCQKITWFRKIDYIIISSIDEGLCFAAAEAMCNGIKPVLHNCEGIKDHYDEKYIFNTIDDAVQMIISDTYKSHEYRSYIKQHFSFEREYDKIRKILQRILEKNDKKEHMKTFNFSKENKFLDSYNIMPNINLSLSDINGGD